MKTKPRSIAEFKSAYAPEPEVVHLRNTVAELRAKLAQNFAAQGEERERQSDLMAAIQQASPMSMAYKPDKSNGGAACTHVLQLTDLHYGGMIRADETDGFGEYSPAIAESRLQELGARVLENTRVMRAGFNVPALHIIGTGDYISGDIHYELQTTNAFPAPVQAVRCGYALGALVAMMAPHFERVEVDMLTSDNHGRLTRKNQSAEGGENNWSFVVAHVVKQHVASLPHVNVNVHATPTMRVTIGPERYLCLHGHQIKGWAGKPYYGFDRRVAMEAVKRMNVPEKSFTKMLLGHYHTAANDLDWQIGGSLSGTDAFDASCGRHAAPHQTSWYVHPEHGEWGWMRWWL